jgi:hypothetical protein
MHIFTEAELKLVEKLKERPAQTVLQIQRPCPTHSVCTPLPLFRIYKINDASFEAQWNGYQRTFHETGIHFADAN